MADGRVVISTALDNTGLKKGISGISGQLGGLQNAIKGIGAAVGIAFGLKALFNFGKAAVEVGSDIAEVQNVVDVAFGDMAYKAENFAATAIESFGMSRLSAKKTASTYMAMAKGMGMNENAASDMAISLAGLTGDVASFFNISQEMADIKLKSVFTGETESLKDLGVVMTQTNLKAYALSQGITKDITTMTQAELVSLRYGFVMDQLALAQGDFARTSDSWANQTRILSERWKEFMSIIGQALITVLTPLVKVLNSIVAGLINMANTFNEVITSIFGGAKTQIQQTAAQTSGVESAIGGSVGNQKDLTKEVKKTSKAAKGAVAAFDELNVLTRIDSGDGDSGGSGILGAAGGGVTIATANPEETISPFVERVLKLLEPLKEISFDNLIDSFNRLKAAVTPLVRSLFDGLMWAYEKIFVPLSKWTIEEVLPRFLNLLSQVLLFLGSVIDACKPGIQWLWDNLLQPIAEWTGGIFLMVIDEISWAIGELTLWFEENGEEISNIIRGIGEVLKYVWDTIRPKLEAAIELVQAIFRRLVTYITGRLDSLVDILSGVVTFVRGVFIGDWEMAWEGVKKIFSGAWNGIANIVENVCNFMIDAVNWVIRQLNKIHIDVPDWITDLTGMTGFGFNIPLLSNVQLPRLAKGAVIPANSEFLAVLGDQKNGRNLEAPENLIRQIVREETGSQTVTLQINADGNAKEFVRWLRFELSREDSRRGVRLVQGGAY